MSWDSFNNGDVFILELNQVIYVWSGSQANRQEKMKVHKSSQPMMHLVG